MNKQRKQRGNATIELASSAVLFAIVALFGLDATVMVIANSVLDEACRDAARAAAQMGNQADAQAAAKMALHRHLPASASNPFLQGLQLVGDITYEDSPTPANLPVPNVNPPISPNTMPNAAYVTVTAQITARMPAAVNAFGAHLGDAPIIYRGSTTYPIINRDKTIVSGTFDNPVAYFYGNPAGSSCPPPLPPSPPLCGSTTTGPGTPPGNPPGGSATVGE